MLVDNTITNEISLIKMCEACNASVKLLFFFSLVVVIMCVTIQKAISFLKKSVISRNIDLAPYKIFDFISTNLKEPLINFYRNL